MLILQEQQQIPHTAAMQPVRNDTGVVRIGGDEADGKDGVTARENSRSLTPVARIATGFGMTWSGMERFARKSGGRRNQRQFPSSARAVRLHSGQAG